MRALQAGGLAAEANIEQPDNRGPGSVGAELLRRREAYVRDRRVDL
jgi:hypothetical protein